MPMLASNYIPEGIKVTLQSENGVLGLVSGRILLTTYYGHNVVNQLSKQPLTSFLSVSSRAHFLMRGRKTQISSMPVCLSLCGWWCGCEWRLLDMQVKRQ